MSENEIFDAVEEMQKAEEAVSSRQHVTGDAGIVRKAVSTIMKEFGIINGIDDVRLDNHTWQVNFRGRMSGGDRKGVAELVSEQLRDMGIKPSAIKMVGLYPKH